MKIVFLDIDGVLNNVLTQTEIYTNGVRLPGSINPNELYPEFDVECVTALNDIILKTDAKIVISSMWRNLFEHYSYLADYLHFRGVVGDVIGITPNHQKPGTYGRGGEIQSWLDENTDKDIKSFVIIDDCDDMDHLMSYLVRTNFSEGLVKRHAEKAIEILNI
jgi:hypothetical protein